MRNHIDKLSKYIMRNMLVVTKLELRLFKSDFIELKSEDQEFKF